MERNEAIESLRQLYSATNAENKAALECLIPELKESEDERIRNLIYCLIRDRSDNQKLLEHNGVSVDKALAYLEKQKEQKPVEIHIDNPNIQKFDADMKITTSDSSADGKELLYVSNKSYDIGFRDGVASVKPAEWSEEDERRIDAICELLENTSAIHPNYSHRKLIIWLKSLRPQPKQEWNEKDEKILDSLILLYSKEYSANAWPWANGVFTYGDVVNFLKSLRPDSYKNCNSRWKPSEEQMAALYTAAREAPIIKENGNYLYDLYDELKKLKV